MKKLLQDRKTLYLVLGLVLVSVFTLSVAYAAMSAVLEIHGNSEVVASSWDIHLDNIKVNSDSVSANSPQISGTSSVGFNVELNTPGEFYEFTVDVVNDGTIDAMIDSVVKTPITGTSYAKYIKYEVSYENGESISSKQTLKSGTSTPIKVRVEYRKDIVASDLPSSSTELSLKLTLVYVQSDGSGSSIPNNGTKIVKVLSGDGTQVGNEVCINEECFYVISSDDTSVTMLSMFNVSLGTEVKQSLKAETTSFSSNGAEYVGSIAKNYVDKYITYITSMGVNLINGRLITIDEILDLGCLYADFVCSDAPSWLYATDYWTGSNSGDEYVWNVQDDGYFGDLIYSTSNIFGIRPVITISRDYL